MTAPPVTRTGDHRAPSVITLDTVPDVLTSPQTELLQAVAAGRVTYDHTVGRWNLDAIPVTGGNARVLGGLARRGLITHGPGDAVDLTGAGRTELDAATPTPPEPRRAFRALTDAQWATLAAVLPAGGPGRSAQYDRRALIDGMRWRHAHGASWRDIPDRFGSWQAAHRLYTRWQRDGTWLRIAARLPARQVKALIPWVVEA